MKKCFQAVFLILAMVLTLVSCGKGDLTSTVVKGEGSTKTADFYSVKLAGEQGTANYDLKKSFRDDYCWYYVYYLGRVEGIPLDMSAEGWTHYTGNTREEHQLSTSTMTAEEVVTAIESSSSKTDGWSKSLDSRFESSTAVSSTVEAKLGVAVSAYGASAGAETGASETIVTSLTAGFSQMVGLNGEKTNTLVQFDEQRKTKELTQSKTTTFTFDPSFTPAGYYKLLDFAMVDVFGIVVYNPNTGKAFVSTVSECVMLYSEMAFSEDKYWESNLSPETLTLNAANLTFTEPEQYVTNIDQELKPDPAPAPIPKTVYLNPNGGFLAQSHISVMNNESFGELPVPEKNGFVFVGWYTQLTGGDRITDSTKADIKGNETTIYAHWTKEQASVVLGNGKSDRHTIRIWHSWGHNDNWHGKDEIDTNLDRDTLIMLGYQKLKVSMTFYYRVDDWGDQLVQILSRENKEVKRFTYEWDERGWTQQTIEFDLSLQTDVDANCNFDIKWYLSKDGTNSDTWVVGGTTLDIRATK